MKHIRILWAAFAATLLGILLAGCGENEFVFSEDSGTNPPDVPGEMAGSMASLPVWGVVTDAQGDKLEGVSVTSGNQTMLTDENGYFCLEMTRVNEGRIIVNFTKEGYFPIQRSCDADQCAGWNVALAATGDRSALEVAYNSSEPQTLNVAGLTIGLPSDCYTSANTGEKYEGTVNASVYYLSPSEKCFTDLMPGSDLAAVGTDGTRMQLVSYGMTQVLLTDAQGNPLQLAEGAQAGLTFPSPEDKAVGTPESIPLWWFDEASGLWREEGEARLNADGTYSGSVSHFTWWNLDPGDETAELYGYVTMEDGTPVEGVRVKVNKQYYTAPTDENGYYKVKVMSGMQFDVRIPESEYPASGLQPKVGGPAYPGQPARVDFVLPTRYKVYGTVTDKDLEPVQASYKLTLPGVEDDKVYMTDREGKFFHYLPKGCSGDAHIRAEAVLGNYNCIVERDFVIPKNENVYLELVLPKAFAHNPDITASCTGEATHYLRVRRPGVAEFGGVIIQDNYLTAFSGMGEYSTRMFDLEIIGYTERQNTYDSFKLMAVDNDKAVVCTGGKLIISRSGDTYIFNLSGKGYYMELDEYGQSTTAVKPANITVNYVGLNHLMSIERRENFRIGWPFPSFTPYLSTEAPVALAVTKSAKLGTGGFIYYNGNTDDFKRLTNQAGSTGFDCVSYDLEEQWGYGDAEYRNGNASISISLDSDVSRISNASWRGKPMFSVFMAEDYDDDYFYESPLSVISLTGGTMSIDDMDFDTDDDYDEWNAPARISRIVRRSARRSRSLLYRK